MQESIEYLSKHEPIGCRDYHTRDLLLENDIDAYFSGCLTLTLENEYSNRNSGGIYLVDLEESIIDELPQGLCRRAERLTHVYPRNLRISTSNQLKPIFGSSIKYIDRTGLTSVYNSIWNKIGRFLPQQEINRDKKFQQARRYLNKYAQAELVVTRRLHATLPCIAFDTPVILVHRNPDDPRFGGIKQYINLYSPDEFAEIADSQTLSNVTNPGDITEITGDLETKIKDFLKS